MKICRKCKIEKKYSKFHKNKRRKDGLRSICKQCKNNYDKKYYIKTIEKRKKQDCEYYKKNRVKRLEYLKTWRKNNKKYMFLYSKKYRKENKDMMKKLNHNYLKSKARYNTFESQISYADLIRNIEGYIQTKCTYCGRWYFPRVSEIQHRIKALNGISNGELRLYCSTKCKKECSIYNRKRYPKGFKKNSSREVQPELRQLVFERDNYTCQKCKKHQDGLNVSLHCHHVEGIKWNPLESADIDQCLTVCKVCHKKIHEQNNCRYNDLVCKDDK